MQLLLAFEYVSFFCVSILFCIVVITIYLAWGTVLYIRRSPQLLKVLHNHNV